jgi:hypothetical protein
MKFTASFLVEGDPTVPMFVGEGTPSEQCGDFLVRVDEVSARWNLIQQGHSPYESGAEAFKWYDGLDGTCQVALVRDPALHCWYVTVSAHTSGLVSDIVTGLSSRLMVRTSQEVLESATENLARALGQLALVCSTTPEARIEGLVQAALDSADLDTRTAGTMFAFLSRWPSLAVPVRSALEKEKDEGLAHQMEWAAHLCEGGDFPQSV